MNGISEEDWGTLELLGIRHTEVLALIAALEVKSAEVDDLRAWKRRVIEQVRDTTTGQPSPPGTDYGELIDRLKRERDEARAEVAAIKERDEEVADDEGWHIGGAWGGYGEVVVPLRILSYVVSGELDQKVVSTDPGYAATYAEQVARADRAEAALERVRALHQRRRAYADDWDTCTCGYDECPCPTIQAIEGADDD